MTSKTILAALLALALGPAAAPALAEGPESFLVPIDGNRNPAPDLDFVGVRVASGTIASGAQVPNTIPDTSKVYHSGPGIFYGVEIATGATTNYVVCFDTASILSNLDNEAQAVRLMNPCIPNTTNSGTCTAGTTLSGAGPRMGKRFYVGLYCVARVTSGNSLQSYIPLFRKDKEK